MLYQQRLYIIDFQDARMGPDTYDLASLLRDAYVDVSEDAVEDLIGYFLELTDRDASEGSHRREFRKRFDLMAAQRTLKALGTFGYQATVRGNPVYTQYIPRTIRNVRNTLGSDTRFGNLHDLLAEHVEELR
jgi:aminoglycoside/choline kinase family phosphotransferase